MVDCWVIHHPPLVFHGTGGRSFAHGPVNACPRAEWPRTAHRLRWIPWLAVPRMMNNFVKNCHGGLLGNTSTPARFSWRGGRGHCPWPCQHAPSSRSGTDSLKAAIEAMAGGAQDADFFLISSHGGLLGYTPHPAQFSWRQ